MTKDELYARWSDARGRLRQAQMDMQEAELDTIKFLVDTRQTHLLKVNWTRLWRDAELDAVNETRQARYKGK